MILRRVARPLLASIFISGGINALRQKEAHTEAVKPWFQKVARKTMGNKTGDPADSLPADPMTLVQVDAAVKVAAGTMLSFGVLPRISSMMLLGSLIPTTLAAHSFWEYEDAEQRQQQTVQFLKNAGLAGGLLLAIADTGGKPSLGWRARHVAEGASHQMQGAAGTVQRKAGRAATKAAKASNKVSGKAGKTVGMVGGTAKGKGKAAKAMKKSARMATKPAKSAMHSKRHRGRMPMPTS
ncbi:DoxX family protein [Saccharomonospora sp.]|uniref:DoxX family protein n=1 Tax=Saccharomonospora sp. TaxID=33913 RepID=UPI0026120037|nr:DoxX family protein [Saccharomonospora sp.]